MLLNMYDKVIVKGFKPFRCKNCWNFFTEYGDIVEEISKLIGEVT